MSQSHLFDDIARALADPMPRRRAVLTVLGLAVSSALATVVRPSAAQAAVTPKGGRCPTNYTNCGNVVCCPANVVCCVNVCCNPGQVCRDGQCQNNASPTSP